MDEELEARRIPKYLDETDKLFGRDIYDVAVLGGGGAFAAMTVYNYTTMLPPLVRTVLAASLIGAGLVLLVKQPAHLSATEWLESVVHGVILPTRMNHVSMSGGTERDTTDFIEKDNWWETSKTTQDLTGIRRIHPTIERGESGDPVGIVERDDGTLISAVEIDGVNMTLATSDQWERRVSELGRVFNSLDFSVQVYVTTDPFDIDDHAERYKDRAEDSDITARPVLGAVLDAYNERVVPSLRQGGLHQRRYYMIVEMASHELYEVESGASPLASAPLIGGFFASDSDMSREEQQRRMADELLERVDSLVSNVGSVRGCQAVPLSSGHLGRLVHEYWSGRTTNDAVNGQFERILPVIVGEEEIGEMRKRAGLDDAGPTAQVSSHQTAMDEDDLRQ